MDVVFQKDKNKQNPFLNKIKDFLKRFKNFKLPNSFYYFLILIAVGFGFYLYMLVENGFSLAYGGDYSAQYIPMGYHIWDYYHEWLSTGHFTLFDSTLYLGVNSFGSNAYYGLFSPFNIIIVLLPRTIVPQSVAISSIIKLACAGLFFSKYMVKAFKVKENVSFICGIAYAFAGWGAFYIWYNNYQDILVFLPIVLLGIEKVIQEEKPWILCAGVFFLAICNYVLMVPYLVCTFFYAMFRYFQLVKTRTFKDNLRVLGLGVIGFAGGLLMALFVVAPAFLATMSSPKLETKSYGTLLKEYLDNGDFSNFFKLLFSWKVAADQHNRVIPDRVYYPILEFFVPSTTCRSLPSLEMSDWDFDDLAVSLWCYVPIIMFLVPALIQSGKEKKWSHYIGFVLLTLTLFTPFMYYLTMGFSNGYARWTLFIISSVIAYVGIYIDKIPNTPRWHIHIGALFAILGVIAAWVLTWKLAHPGTKVATEYVHRFTYVDDKDVVHDYTNIAFTIELLYVIGVYIALFFTYYKKAFHIVATALVSAEAICVGTFVTIGHGWDNSYNNGYAYNENFRKILNGVKANDPSYFRIYSSIDDGISANNSFINNYRSVSFFHSLYNFEIDDFTLWTGLRNGSKSVSGDYRGKYQDIDNLLGVKYYFISKEKSKQKLIEKYYPNAFEANVPFDFDRNIDYEDGGDFMVYENKNLPDFGVSYTTLSYDSWWCSELVERSITASNGKKVYVKYDDCSPFGMIAGDFGDINQLERHSSQSASYYVNTDFNNMGNYFDTFMAHFDIPTTGATYQSTITTEILEDYNKFFETASSVYNRSYASFTKNIKSTINNSAVIGLNYPYQMTFGGDIDAKAVDYLMVMANLFGFSGKQEFMNYAQALVDTYADYRLSRTYNALENGCFYVNNSSFIFPIAVKNELNIPVLMHLIIDTHGLISIWVNDMTAALKATNFNKDYQSKQDINNELYEKNRLFITGGDHLPNDKDGARYDVEAINNAMILSTNAIVGKQESKEIKEEYNNFTISNVKPSTSTLKPLYVGTDYEQKFYDLREWLTDYWYSHQRKYAYDAKEYPFQSITSIPNDFPGINEDDYIKSKTRDYFVFYTPKVDGQPLIKENTTLYLKAAFWNSIKYDVYFIDKDNNIFMYDCHDDDTTNNTCYMRGFYIRKDVYKIAIVGKWGESYIDSSTLKLYVEDRDDYNTRKQALFAHPVENVKNVEDKFTFETKYDENRFVVSRVAYDKGWSIKAKNNDTGKSFDVKIYKGNGAFISFVAPQGNISYTMTYQTPYLGGSSVVSLFAITSFFVSMLGYHLYHENKRSKHLDDIYREN